MNLTSNKDYIDSYTPLDRIIHSARLLSLTKSKKWLNKLIDTGKVITHGDSSITTPERKENFKVFISIMVDGFNRRYGNDWDIHIEKYGTKYKIDFFTVFPVIKISNSTDLEHTITDLIVSYPIGLMNSQIFYIKRIRGTRTSLFRKELDASYCHSHLTKNTALCIMSEPFSLKDFCIGYGDLSILESTLRDNFTVRALEGFLYEVDATLRWESLSGSPYVYIRNINPSTQIACVPSNTDRDIFLEDRMKSDIPLTYYIADNTYKIKADDVFENFVKDSILNVPFLKDNLFNNVLCIYNAESKNYYRPNSEALQKQPIPQVLYGSERAYMIYNGQKKYINIKEDVKTLTEVPLENYIVHPQFLKNVHTSLESILKTKVIRHSAIAKYRALEHIS